MKITWRKTTNLVRFQQIQEVLQALVVLQGLSVLIWLAYHRCYAQCCLELVIAAHCSHTTADAPRPAC